MRSNGPLVREHAASHHATRSGYGGFALSRLFSDRQANQSSPRFRLRPTCRDDADLARSQRLLHAYGDVRELLSKTDDRYVIMNAGMSWRSVCGARAACSRLRERLRAPAMESDTHYGVYPSTQINSVVIVRHHHSIAASSSLHVAGSRRAAPQTGAQLIAGIHDH